MRERNRRRVGEGRGGIKEEAEEKGSREERELQRWRRRESAQLPDIADLSSSAPTGMPKPTPCISLPSRMPRIFLVGAKPRLFTSQEAEFSHNFSVTFTVGRGNSNELINPVTGSSVGWHCKWHPRQVRSRCRQVSLISQPTQSIDAACCWGEDSRLTQRRRQMTHLWIQRCWGCRWPCLWMFSQAANSDLNIVRLQWLFPVGLFLLPESNEK